MSVHSGTYEIPCKWDFSEFFAAIERGAREARRRGRKAWIEEWFADQMGMTVQQWREAQMRVRGLTLEQVKP